MRGSGPGGKRSVLWQRAWFALNQAERWVLVAVLGIALVGLTARYFYLKSERPEPYRFEELPADRGEEWP